MSTYTNIAGTISRDKAVPLYIQIKEIVKRNIIEGHFKPNECIPSERELCKIFNVSYITVRQALGELTKEGFLVRVQGRGTFVPDLKEGRGLSIGLVIPETARPISPYFISGLILGIKRVSRKAGYSLTIFAETETEYLKAEGIGPLSGLILTDPQMRDARITILAEKHFPFVVLGNPGVEGIPFVDSDNVEIGYTMARHLLERGTRRPAFINGPMHWTVSEDRLRGFTRAVEEAGIDAQAVVVEHGSFTEESGYACTRKILRSYPETDALICADDVQAIGAVRALREMERKIGTNVMVACCNNSEFTQYIDPPLSTMEIFPEELGAACAEKLIAIMSGRPVDPCSYIAAKLICRASTGGNVAAPLSQKPLEFKSDAEAIATPS